VSAVTRSGLRPAVFLDRDGTLIREIDYLADPDRVELLPGAVEGLQALRDAGFALVLVTNQSGVARGLLTLDMLDAIHDRLVSLLRSYDLALDGIEFCPHHPEIGATPFRRKCGCRKPAAGMLLKAATQLNLDLSGSWMIGDAVGDLQAGAAAGMPSILVRTGKGRSSEGSAPDGAHVVDDLAQAAALILGS
jgi:D-glycero-D-manno-heptose 1,7-bisphosphate phosphatase